MKNHAPNTLLAGLLLALVACGSEQDAADSNASSSVAAAPTAAPMSSNAAVDAVSLEQQLHEHVRILASDEFEGRAPATAGEEKTINFLKAEFEKLGIGPGNGDSYFQAVDVTEITTVSDAVLSIQGDGFATELRYGDQMMVGTQQQLPAIGIEDSDMVFVGYGINAPERNWNDYEGLDVRGKTVVILVNDPGFATQQDDVFNGNAMTYYGRWTYKYEEAARQGAGAALIVHETAPAGYGWEVVNGSWSGPQIALEAEDLNRDRANIEGWLTLDSAEEVFRGAGMDYQQMKAAAAQSGFRGVPMPGLRASVNISNAIRNSSSQNVVAAIPGSTRPDETIIYTAHWDHLGVNVELEGDQIYNGAVDNATGTAALLALARLHANQETPPERTIVFLAVTAEESGLLGSQWYAEHPIYPLETTVANINMDAMNTNGKMRDIVVVGDGSSELEDYLAEAAANQNRYLTAEPTPERGYYYRSDHFNFAKVGVPALYAESGEDSLENGQEWGAARSQDYTDNRYHTPADEYDPNWDFSGTVLDIELYFTIGQKLSMETSFPNWYEGNEFKAVRDASSASRNR